ncbi:hypothetical protein [Methylotuvimicrobium sp. KM2]
MNIDLTLLLRFERRQSKTEAEQALTQWLERIKALGLDCFAPFITTLDN